MKHRRAARVDDNQAEIVRQLRKIPGVSVELGHDDILVGFRGRTFWFEIKNKEGKNRKQDSQKKIESTWTGHYSIVHTFGEILQQIGVTK